jgi:HAD superfamily hydrolase (TIGR01458 family)
MGGRLSVDQGVLLDIDGVLIVSWQPLAGAVETLGWLGDRGVEIRLVTNTSSQSRRQIAERLASVGMPVGEDRILTAVTSAARYLAEHHPGARCLVLNEGDLSEDLRGVESAPASSADLVLLGGAGPSVGYPELDAAFRMALDGAPVVALHRNTRFQTTDGPALDMGAFVIGLEAAAGIEIPVVGKPSPSFYRAALADLGTDPARTVMVGDDLVSDVLGAQAVGITGVLVRTGKFRPSDLEGAPGRPDRVIDDIGAFPRLLDRLGESARGRVGDPGLRCPDTESPGTE